MHKKIISLVIIACMLIPIALFTNTANAESVIEVKNQIKTEQNEWVNQIQTHVGDTLRIKITVTYHDLDGDGIGIKLEQIVIKNHIPEGLTYLGNATREEESYSTEDTIIWDLGNLILLDGESYELEFDAQVNQEGVINNYVVVDAIESCYGDPRRGICTSTIISSYEHEFKQKDVDNDCEYEKAIDQNDDPNDGYEIFEDPDGSSVAKKSKDGDNDGKTDHLIDTNEDNKPDKYWDPDDDILTDIIIKDVDYDETEEWVFDSDDNGELDKYYDPDDDQIHDYTIYTLEITTDGDGTVNIEPNYEEFLKDTEVTLTAIASNNWSFNYWTGNDEIDGSNNLSETIIIDEDKTITAHFIEEQPEKYTLTVNTDGQGTVNINPDQTNYTEGTTVTLNANPETNWVFDHWSGDATGEENSIEILMDSNKNITGHFKEDVIVDTEKPFVNITKPKEKKLYKNNEEKRKTLLLTRIIGAIDIEVEAYDEESGIEKVEFLIDNESKYNDSGAPYIWTWNDSNLFLKIKTIKVKAYDKAGNTNTSEIKVMKLGNFYKFGSAAGIVGGLVLLASRLSNKPTEDEDDSEDGTTTNKPPVAEAEGPSSSQTNKKIIFDASKSYDPEQDQLTYSWDFGDGNTATGKQVNHEYKQKGTYKVTLTVTDSQGSTDTTTLTININKPEKSEADNTFWIIAGTLGAVLTSIVAAVFVRRKIYV